MSRVYLDSSFAFLSDTICSAFRSCPSRREKNFNAQTYKSCWSVKCRNWIHLKIVEEEEELLISHHTLSSLFSSASAVCVYVCACIHCNQRRKQPPAHLDKSRHSCKNLVRKCRDPLRLVKAFFFDFCLPTFWCVSYRKAVSGIWIFPRWWIIIMNKRDNFLGCAEIQAVTTAFLWNDCGLWLPLFHLHAPF